MRDADVKRFIALVGKKRRHEEQAEELAGQIAELESKLMASFVERGVDRVTMDGQTVWIDRKLWAGAENGDSQATCAALAEAGLGDFVKPGFNVQQLSSWVRELEKAAGRKLPQDQVKDLLPEPLRPFVRITEKYNLRVRKAS